MIRRLLVGFALAAVALSTLAVVAPPADANNPDADRHYVKCIDIGESAGACMEVWGHSMAGGGTTINYVYLELTGGFWESKAADCDNVRMWNQDSVIRWRKDDAECDIYRDWSPSHNAKQDLFNPSIEAYGATSLTVGWTFQPKLDAEADGPSRHISITVP